MTRLRKMMLEELQRRNYAQTTVEAYIHALQDFAQYFHRPPDQLGPEHIRQYQVYLLRDRKLAANTVKQRVAAVRFFFVRTLKRPYLREDIPYPKSTTASACRTQPGRSGPADRWREQSVASSHVDDAVLHWSEASRDGPPKSQ